MWFRPKRWIVTIPSFDQWLATIEKPLGVKAAIVKPLKPMVGGTIEKPALPFYGLTNG